jgi:Tetratricopeptide repeat
LEKYACYPEQIEYPDIFFVFTLHIMHFVNPSVVTDDPEAFVTLEVAKTLQSIYSLNHLGVSYFNHGNYSNAILCFERATKTLKSRFNEQDSENQKVQVTCRCCTSLLVIPSPAKLSVSPPQQSSVEEAQITNDVTSMNRRMYSLPFEMMAMTKHCNDAKHTEQVLVDEQLLLSKLSIVLIFNLAMAHHVLAVVMMTANSESYTTSTTTDATLSAPRDLLLKACRLYNLASSIPQNNPCLCMIWPCMLSLFVKAILNNLGHCYASLGSTKNSVQCFEFVENMGVSHFIG